MKRAERSEFEAQRKILNEVFEIAAEEVWTISIFASPPHPVVVKNGFPQCSQVCHL